MILVIQFRKDQSGPHELKAIYDSGGISFDNYRAVNISSGDISSPELVDIARKSRGVMIGGWGENGYEAETNEQKRDLKKVIELISPLIEYVVEDDKPTLGMCFGHQLIADVLGGVVSKDTNQAETGIGTIFLTKDGRGDPLFKTIGEEFYAVVGHKASVTKLPDGAIHLASSEKSKFQSFRLGANVYGTQFHPELDLNSLEERLDLYPEYRENSIDFVEGLRIEADKITKEFVKKATSFSLS